MRILIVGGTRFVGRYLTAEAVDRGHDVTVLHRGASCAGAPGVTHLHADRDVDLSVLGGSAWDAVVDTCAYYPAQVTLLADALGDRGGRHLLISTISVYDRLPEPELDESAPLKPAQGLDGDAPAMSPATYGPLKVGCEHVARQRYEGGLLVVRPTFVVGPHDHTGRFPYWVARAARGGRVLAPGRPESPLQHIDARDLAAFCVKLLEDGEEGTLHVMSESTTWGEALAELDAAVGPRGNELVWPGSPWLTEQGVRPADLPLWTGSDDADYVMSLDPARAVAAGLHCRPLGETAVDTMAWLGEPGATQFMRTPGLTAQREAELLDAWSAEGA